MGSQGLLIYSGEEGSVGTGVQLLPISRHFGPLEKPTALEPGVTRGLSFSLGFPCRAEKVQSVFGPQPSLASVFAVVLVPVDVAAEYAVADASLPSAACRTALSFVPAPLPELAFVRGACSHRSGGVHSRGLLAS